MVEVYENITKQYFEVSVHSRYHPKFSMPKWFEPRKEPEWFIQANEQWGDSSITMPD